MPHVSNVNLKIKAKLYQKLKQKTQKTALMDPNQVILIKKHKFKLWNNKFNIKHNNYYSDRYEHWAETLGEASWKSSDPSSLKNSNSGKASYKKFIWYTLSNSIPSVTGMNFAIPL